jgi:hypothetical protein
MSCKEIKPDNGQKEKKRKEESKSEFAKKRKENVTINN